VPQRDILGPTARARYADAVVAAGAALRRGDLLVVRAGPEQREIVVAVAEAAYRRGARHVEVEVGDPLVAAARLRDGRANAIGVRAPWETARARALLAPDAAILHVSGESDPEAFRGIDPGRIAADHLGVERLIRPFRRGVLDSTVRWAIAGWPTTAWAARVYPELAAADARRKLGRDLLSFCRVGPRDGPGFSGWIAHVQELERRARTLNRLRLRRLELRGPGTALDLGLVEHGSWQGGRDRTSSGRLTSPNMPTEEVFTSPAPAATSGTFRCTLPLVFRGTTIEGIGGEFRNGRLVRLDAASPKQRDLLATMLDVDRGARRLGEVALVDSSSRVGRAGRVYFDTLLDENAATHIAFGSGYDTTRAPGAPRVNRSALHLDVMIGSDELEVTGITARGRRVALVADGEFQV
jgi:aminopeptidase